MTVAPIRTRAWVCTGCLAHWVFRDQLEAIEADAASREHRCVIEGAATIIVDAEFVPELQRKFGRRTDS